MKKRLEFQCWNCPKTYTLLRDVEEGNPQLSVGCPFCGAAAIVDLYPYRKPIDTIYKIESPQNRAPDETETVYELPDILPTQPKVAP